MSTTGKGNTHHEHPSWQAKASAEEMTVYDQSGRRPVLLGFLIAVIWLLAGTVLGDLSSFKFDRPDLLTGQAYLTFGRIRPAHLNAMVYGWASTAMFSVSLWLMPRLCRTPLRWGGLATWGILIWTLGLAIGLGLLLAGHSDGLEWLELDRVWADPLLVAGAAMVGASVCRTLAARNVHHMYVSVWYVAASYPWFLIIFLAGNLPFYRGAESAAVNWFYAHNALGLWLTAVNLALIYYLLPKIIGRPIYSYWLSLVGFWALALFYALNGMHHLIGGPIPSWMIATSITASIMMVIPVIAVGINQHMTVVGRFGAMRYSPALTLAVIAAMSYTAVSLQGILTALVSVNRITHFTHWTIAHSHLGLYMFVTLSLFGGMYYILPRVLKREWPSRSLIRIHILLTGGGMALYIVALGIGGVLQGLNLLAPGVGFEASVASTKPWLLLRSISAVIISAGHVAFIYHAWLLAFSRRGRASQTPPFIEFKPVLVKRRPS
ncbi:cbb3-type cytochrome c oxidase subunit I [Methylobacillus pratensis]